MSPSFREPSSSLVLVATLLLVLVSSAARHRSAEAQPGRAPAPANQPLPPGFHSNPYGANYYLLSAHERELLLQGEISFGQTVGGGVLSLWLGFGIGHMAQGRYGSVGWKFTVGELAAIAGFSVGVGMAAADGYNNQPDAGGENLIIVSAIAYGILRVWEAIDAFTGPSVHNEKVRAARWKARGTPYYGFFVAPSQDRSGGIAGLHLRF